MRLLPSNCRGRRSGCFRPSVEQLETRTLLSGFVAYHELDAPVTADGVKDIIFTNNYTFNTLQALGSRTFQLLTPVNMARDVYALGVSDFTSDGFGDVVVTSNNGNNTGQPVATLYAGTTAGPIFRSSCGPWFAPYTARGVAVGEFDALTRVSTFVVVAPQLSLAATDAVKPEGSSDGASLWFTVTRSGDTSSATSVSYAVTGNDTHPADAEDFVGGILPSDVVSFAANETTKQIAIPVAADTAVEFDKGFSVTLSGATGGAVITSATANGTIQNDDTANLTIDDVTLAEGQPTGTTAFTFTVTSSNPVAADVIVDYATVDNTATTADDDYGQATGTLTFGANGVLTQTVTVTVTKDSKVENDEMFHVNLSNPKFDGVTDSTRATIAKVQGVGTIANDDVSSEPTVDVTFQLIDLNGVPGITVNEAFEVDVLVTDIRNAASPQAVFTAYADIHFDPAEFRVDQIVFDSDYSQARTGTIDNVAGLVNEAGANTDSISSPPASPRVLTLQMTALARGTTQITADAGENVLSEIVVYGDENDQRAHTRFESLTVSVVDFPDLIGQSFSVQTGHIPGGQADLAFTIANTGSGAAGEFQVNVVLSDNAVLGDTDDVVVQTLSYPSLAGNSTLSDTLTVPLPRNTLYVWAKRDDPANLGSTHVSTSADYVGLVIDPADSIVELSNANNFGRGLGVDADDVSYFPWDFNQSWTVTGSDVMAVVNRLGQDVPPADPRADLDGNGVVTGTEAMGAVSRLGYTGNNVAGTAGGLAAFAAGGLKGGLGADGAPDAAEVNLEVQELDGMPGLAVGEQFEILVHFRDLTASPSRAVYTAYTDLAFPPAFLEVNSLTFSGSYGNARTGTFDNTTGVVEEAGATASDYSTPPASDVVLTLRVTALAQGSATVASNVGETPLSEIVLYGNEDDQRTHTAFGSLTVQIGNSPPTINDIGNLTLDEDATDQLVNLTGITPGGGETQTLQVTASSDNTGLIPNPAVTYTSPQATGSLALTPAEDQSGTAVITVTVRDAGLDGTLGNTDDGTFARSFTVTVNPVNDPPTLDASGNQTLDEDAPAQTVPLTGIIAGGGESQTLQITVASDNPVVIPNPTVTYTSPQTTGTLTFTPVGNQSGTAIITVAVCDAGLDGTLGNADDATSTQSFTVTVNPVNDPPTLDGIGNLTLNEDAPAQMVSLTGITAGDGESQSLRVTATSANTGLIPNPAVAYTSPQATGNLTFAPSAGQSGTAVVAVAVRDAGLDGVLDTTDDGLVTRSFTVTVNPVNDPGDDQIRLWYVPTDLDGKPITAVAVGDQFLVQVWGEDLRAVPQGVFSIYADMAFNSGLASVAGPTVFAPDYPYGQEGDASQPGLVDELGAHSGTIPHGPGARRLCNVLFVATAAGIIEFLSDPADQPEHQDVLYGAQYATPTEDVDYDATTLRIVSEAPHAADDHFTVAEDGAVNVDAAQGLLANDHPGEGTTMTVTVVSDPVHGTLVWQPNGAFSYTPERDFFGQDTFTYRVNDGLVDSPAATVQIDVAPINDAPVAAADAYRLDEDQAFTVDADQGVLANDTDVDQDPLRAVLATPPLHGSLTLGADGSFVYVPETNFNGPDSFTYRTDDGQLPSNETTVALTIDPVNDAPLALDQMVTTIEDQTIEIALYGGDGDPEVEQNLTFLITSLPAAGSLSTTPGGPPLTAADLPVLVDNGRIFFSPAANSTGSQVFTFVPIDDGGTERGGQDAGAEATVTIHITPVNDVPEAQPDEYAVARGMALVVSSQRGLLANDADVDGDTLSVRLVDGPTHGELQAQPDGSFTYQPAVDFVGTDSFVYRSADGQAESPDTLVTIHVLEPRVSVRLEVTNLAGEPVSHVLLGETYRLQAMVRDVSSDPHGVYAAYLDVTYDGAASATAGPLQFGPTFANAHSGTIEPAGLIDEAGAAGDFERRDGDEAELARST